jgi:hypothetical protein
VTGGRVVTGGVVVAGGVPAKGLGFDGAPGVSDLQSFKAESQYAPEGQAPTIGGPESRIGAQRPTSDRQYWPISHDSDRTVVGLFCTRYSGGRGPLLLGGVEVHAVSARKETTASPISRMGTSVSGDGMTRNLKSTRAPRQWLVLDTHLKAS